MDTDTRTKCPVCGKMKPVDAADLHDVVLPRMDWRQAARPERTHITVPVGELLMCHECFLRIEAEFSPGAPRFDEKGLRCLL